MDFFKMINEVREQNPEEVLDPVSEEDFKLFITVENIYLNILAGHATDYIKGSVDSMGEILKKANGLAELGKVIDQVRDQDLILVSLAVSRSAMTMQIITDGLVKHFGSYDSMREAYRRFNLVGPGDSSLSDWLPDEDSLQKTWKKLLADANQVFQFADHRLPEAIVAHMMNGEG